MTRKHERWHPPRYEPEDVRAVQALALYAQQAEVPSEPGDEVPAPSPHQVKRALDWIIHIACGTYDEPFAPGQPDVKDYLMGRRSVGLSIVKLMKIKPELIQRNDK